MERVSLCGSGVGVGSGDGGTVEGDVGVGVECGRRC